MSVSSVTAIDPHGIDWPAPVPIDAARVVAGAPAASTVILEDGGSHQLGMWRVTAGEFTTDHAGYIEYIYILEGSGSLVGDGGTTALRPGVVVLMPTGWAGRWVVDTPITKVFSIIHAGTGGAPE